MNENIGILGGDLRIIFLAKMLEEDGYNVYSYGIDKCDIFKDKNNRIFKCEKMEELSNYCDIIISAIPFSKDGIRINSPFSINEIIIDKSLSLLKNKRLIVGTIKKEIKEKAMKKNIDIIDLMEDETLTILNIIPTVEGAIQTAIENTNFTIHNSNCLILGFGRIGKLLSKTLKSFGANVNVVARKEKDFAWIKLCGYNDINLNELEDNLRGYDIVFNTVPALILNNEKLKLLKDNSNRSSYNRTCIKPWWNRLY